MTLREVLINESLNPKMDKILDRFEKKPVSKELISAGTGKEIARTGFERDYSFPEGYEIQMVKTTDGNFDVYFMEKSHLGEPYKCKECYIGTIEDEKNEFRAWHNARVMCYNSPKVDKKIKEFIKKDVNHKLNMDRYEKDENGKTWYKEID